MKVTGSTVLHAPREDVWKALTDPNVLVRTIPGCRQLEQTGPDTYRMTVFAGVASVKGEYQGEVRLTDQQPPESFVLRASGAGAPGTVQADVHVALSDEGGTTRLDYAADAVVGGVVGGVGQRVLTGVAKKTAAEFFTAVDQVLTGAVPEEVAAPVAPTVSTKFTAPPKPPRAAVVAGRADFVAGVAVGAAVALLGALVGGWLAGRRRA